MKQKIALSVFALFLFQGCSAAFHYVPCAHGPDDSVLRLFAALQSTDAISTDLEGSPADLRRMLDLKKIMAVTPDPQKLLASFGKGDIEKGLQELKFLKGLSFFYGRSGLEFQEYTVSVASARRLPSEDVSREKYQMRLVRIDTLLDMRDANDFREVKKAYQRDFTAEFLRGSYCVVVLTPEGEWEGVR